MPVKFYDKITPNQYALLDVPFFEGAGSVVHDLSRRHHNGAFAIAPTWTQLASGVWVLRYTAGASANLGASVDWALLQLDFSFECWLRKGNLSPSWLWGQDDGMNLQYTYIYAQNAIIVHSQDPFGFPPSNETMQTGTLASIGFTLAAYHHVVITRSAVVNWTAYVDKAPLAMTGNTALTMRDWGFVAQVGRAVGGDANTYSGRPRLYINYAMTQDVVSAHFTKERPLYP